jgi:predicted transposase/invertase (TIGR01784 family)
MDEILKEEKTEKDRNLIRFDWALKRLLRNKADYVVLEGFLSVLLGENVKITHIMESEGNQTDADNKYNRVDIMVENETREIFIIELQNCHQIDYFFRMLFGVSKAITDHMKIADDDYKHVRKVYHINIIYFNLGEGIDYVYHGTTSFKGIHHGDELQLTKNQQAFFKKSTIPDIYPEYYILKIKGFDDYAKDNLDQWIYYLKNNAIPNDFTAPGLPEARERLLIDNMSTAERAAYEAYRMELSDNYSTINTAKEEGKEEGREEGRKEGRKEGEEKRKKLQETLDQKDSIIASAVKNLFEKGLSYQQITQIMQLDIEEVTKILTQ